MSFLPGRVGDVPPRPHAPRVSVVIPVRNAAATIGEQLAALAVQTYSGWWELVVADNGSDDSTLDVVRQWSDRLPQLRIVDASARRGATYARNAGAEAAEGELVVFCDADDAVAPTWIEALCAAAADADLIGGHIDMEELNGPVVRQWRSSPTAAGLPVPMGLWPHVISANFGVWRDVYLGVGGCDESFTYGGEEVDLSWRIQQAGGRIGFASDAVVHYRLRTDLRATHRQFIAYGMGAALLYRKFRTVGCVRPPFPGAVKYWLKLIQKAPRQLAAPAQRGTWVVDASYHWGRIRGALSHRVVFW